MPRYVLAVVRTTYYRVDADTPEGAWDAYGDAPMIDHDDADTEGHYVMAADEDERPTGPVLFSEGDLVPPVEEVTHA